MKKSGSVVYPSVSSLSTIDLDTTRVGEIIRGYSRRFSSVGHKIIELDVEADPEKRGAAWLEKERRRMNNDKAFAQEFLRDWTVGRGKDFYPEFSLYYPRDEDGRRPRVVVPASGLVRGLPIRRGFDFGFRRPACVWFQYSPRQHRVWVLREFLPSRVRTGTFADLVRYLSGEIPMSVIDDPRGIEILGELREAAEEGLLPPAPWFPEKLGGVPLQFTNHAGPEALDLDASVEWRTKEMTDADVFASHEIHLQMVKVSIASRETSLRELLKPHLDGFSGILFDPFCSCLINGFGGGITFPEPSKANPEPTEPKKDGLYEHLHDALGYGVTQVVPLEQPKIREDYMAQRRSIVEPNPETLARPAELNSSRLGRADAGRDAALVVDPEGGWASVTKW